MKNTLQSISSIVLSGQKEAKQAARESVGVNYNAQMRSLQNSDLLELLPKTTISMLDRKIKHGENLSFEEAFCGMCYVLGATNSHLFELFQPSFMQAYGADFSREKSLAIASAFLNLMATKEALSFLTAEEIAGMVAAAMMDPVITLEMPRVIETSGMGGDKGFEENGVRKKSINVSTLSALVLSALGLPAVKHGSYGNTSAVGSTESIEQFGALTSMHSEQEVWRIFKESGFCFFDAHWCKTIHDLSHLLMMETINHVIGPMTPPISSCSEINKVMGVNEKVHPATIAKAYALLHQKGKQKVGGVIVVSGLDKFGMSVNLSDFTEVKRHVIVDEISPYWSIISMTLEDRHLGTFLFSPSEYGIRIDPRKIQISNNPDDIQQANIAALSGKDKNLSDYLAVNAAFGLYATEYLRLPKSVTQAGLNIEYFMRCFQRCQEAIYSGQAKNVLANYVKASGGNLPC
jgi:anthranilate phosphoribosyltransferase